MAALSEHGPGFSIGAAHGEVSIPAEGSDTAAVLQLADQRLYARKEQRHSVDGPVVFGLVDRRSVDAEHGELALAPRQRHRDAVIGAAPEQGDRDRGVGRQPALRGCGVVGADNPPSVLGAILGTNRTVEPKPTTPSLAAFPQRHRRGDLLTHARDLRLQVRLLVLGVVVLAVLLQVPPLARSFDPLGDLPAALSLELRQLGFRLCRPSAVIRFVASVIRVEPTRPAELAPGA